jgi:hypothetical protein
LRNNEIQKNEERFFYQIAAIVIFKLFHLQTHPQHLNLEPQSDQKTKRKQKKQISYTVRADSFPAQHREFV